MFFSSDDLYRALQEIKAKEMTYSEFIEIQNRDNNYAFNGGDQIVPWPQFCRTRLEVIKMRRNENAVLWADNPLAILYGIFALFLHVKYIALCFDGRIQRCLQSNQNNLIVR